MFQFVRSMIGQLYYKSKKKKKKKSIRNVQFFCQWDLTDTEITRCKWTYVFKLFVMKLPDYGSDEPKHAANCCTILKCCICVLRFYALIYTKNIIHLFEKREINEYWGI